MKGKISLFLCLAMSLSVLGLGGGIVSHSPSQITPGVFDGDFSFDGVISLKNMNLTPINTTGYSKIYAKTTSGLDNYTKLLLHMDGTDGSTTFTDSSLQNHTVSAQGNARINTSQYKFGGASG